MSEQNHGEQSAAALGEGNGAFAQSPGVASEDEAGRGGERDDGEGAAQGGHADRVAASKLAELFDELRARHRRLEDQGLERGASAEGADSRGGAGDFTARVGGVAGAVLEELQRGWPGAAGAGTHPPARTQAEGELDGLIQALKGGLERYVQGRLEAQRAAFRQQLEEMSEQMQGRMEEVAAEIRTAYREAYAQKERALAKRADELTALAESMYRRKVEVQYARRQLEEKLLALSRLQSEATRMGEDVTERLGALEGLVEGRDEELSIIERALEGQSGKGG